MQGFKCDRCKVIDGLDGMGGLDEMGPEVWAVNWDHYPISRDSAEMHYPNQIWEPVNEWAKARNIGRMVDELGRVRLLHRYCHTFANKYKDGARVSRKYKGLLVLVKPSFLKVIIIIIIIMCHCPQGSPD